jgi:hypothetical protein
MSVDLDLYQEKLSIIYKENIGIVPSLVVSIFFTKELNKIHSALINRSLGLDKDLPPEDFLEKLKNGIAGIVGCCAQLCTSYNLNLEEVLDEYMNEFLSHGIETGEEIKKDEINTNPEENNVEKSVFER